MSVIESPHTKQCWGIDASGLGDDEWLLFREVFPHAIRWSPRLWVCYWAKNMQRKNWPLTYRTFPFFRIEEPPTPRGKKVTILPGAKGL